MGNSEVAAEDAASEALQGSDRRSLAIVALVSLGACAWVSWRSGVALSTLGVFFDGHLYLEIARSFPAPYPPESVLYSGQAPGYSAAIWLGRLVVPDAWLNWGELALVVAWSSSAASAVAFGMLARTVGMSPLWPGILFAVGNPRWLAMAPTAHPEPIAMFFVIATLIAHLRGRLAWSVLFLALATLCRFPAILIGGPLAMDLLLLRRQRDLRTVLWLGFPLLALGVWNLYLALRIPGFTSVWHAHQTLWQTELTVPFSSLGATLAPGPHAALTYATIGLYVLAAAIGFRRAERRLWVLPLCVVFVAGFHLSLTSDLALRAFTRLAALAWPAALLIVWRVAANRLPDIAVGLLCTALLAVGLPFASAQSSAARLNQLRQQHWMRDSVARLDVDEPRWYELRKKGGRAGGAASRLR